jgi:FixJ family two-component response regulator
VQNSTARNTRLGRREIQLIDHTPVFVVAVVDDEPSILQSLDYLLQSADYDVRLFTSATALLDSGCLPQVNCLISDIDMPGMDGLELLRLVNAAHPGLPTILITGYPERVERLTTLGGTYLRFFTKPFHGPELLAAVDEAMDSYRA